MLSWIKAECAKRSELRRLAVTTRQRPRPTEPQLVMLDRDKATWLIPLSDDRQCFMCACAGMIQHEKFVVMVDAEAFYYAWLQGSRYVREQRGADCILRADMPKDYK